MYSVMLVDDDHPVLEFLSAIIPWQQMGLSLHSACKNGIVALEQAGRQLPDIVVTDIGMPQMDGLELIDRLKRLKPDVRCIILSCMDDFAYAQRAVQLQVNDYVLKETMQPEQIAGLLNKLKDELDREATLSAQNNRWKRMAEESEITLNMNLLQRLLSPAAPHESDWTGEARALGIEFTGPGYLPVLCWLNRYKEVQACYQQDLAIMLDMVNAAQDIVAFHPGVRILPYSAKEYILLFPYRRTLKENAATAFQPLIRSLQADCAKRLGVTVSFLYGAASGKPEALKEQIAFLLHSGQARFYLDEGGIYTPAALGKFSGEDLYEFYPAALQQIRNAFLEEDEEQLYGAVRDWMSLIRSHRFPVEIVKEWTLKILYDNQSRFLTLQQYQTTFSLEVLHRSLVEIGNIDELTDWTLKFFEDRLPLVRLIYRQSRRSEILRAQQYVTKHMQRKITLEEVADMLHINSSYFSRLFKKETGYNFIHYVTLSKMERAKEMLSISSVSVEEVADKLGYDNKSYFTKLFKKHTGDTPGDYRGM